MSEKEKQAAPVQDSQMNLDQADRIGKYLVPHLKEMLFDELSEGYLKKAGMADILMDVPVPIRKSDLGGGISTLTIARGMAFVIGCDPGFKYKENYVEYIIRSFGKKFAEGLVADGVEGAEKNDYDYACIQFRSAMLVDPENADAYYCYGRACKDAYETASGSDGNFQILTENGKTSASMSETEEFIGRFKAESLEAFEVATLKNPQLSPAFYFLGYAYANMGLYVKAKLTWDDYLKLTAADLETMTGESLEELRKLRKEIEDRVLSMKDPVAIEKGYNLILSSRFEEGIQALDAYRDSEYAGWWPLWYYLGAAHEGLDEDEEAIECLLKVLSLAPSNTECMEKLEKLYQKQGNEEKAEKYRRKIQIVKDNLMQDRKLAEENEAAQKASQVMMKDATGKIN